MSKSELFFVFVIAFLVGITCGDFIMQEWWVGIFVLVGMGGYFLIRFYGVRMRLVVVVLLGVLCGVFRLIISFEEGIETGDVELQGQVCREVDVRVDKVKYTLCVEGVEGKVLVTGPRYPAYEYGDCLLVSGILDEAGEIENFDYGKYLARYGVYGVIYQAGILQEECEEKRGFYYWVFRFKAGFEGRMSEIFLEPHSSFMAGLILGSRKGIPDKLMLDFNTTGLTHIIAISGYNITLIIVIVSGMFSFMSKRMRVVASGAFILVFVILVGASAAVVRAGIMGAIALSALWFGRAYYVTLGLLFSAFLMNLWEPKILIYDVGFQLSFLATCGLLYVSPKIEKWFLWLPKWMEIRESVMMTISAQILALPVIVLNFGRLSLVSPLANLFVLPFLPLSMFAGFMATSLSYVSMEVGQVFGLMGYLFLEFIVLVIEIFADVPGASVDVEWWNWWMMVLYYFFVLRWVFK